MGKQIIGVIGYGSVEIEAFTSGGFDGFPEQTHYTIEAVTPRLMGLVSRVQQTTCDLDRAKDIRAACEQRVCAMLGVDSADFDWKA